MDMTSEIKKSPDLGILTREEKVLIQAEGFKIEGVPTIDLR